MKRERDTTYVLGDKRRPAPVRPLALPQLVLVVLLLLVDDSVEKSEDETLAGGVNDEVERDVLVVRAKGCGVPRCSTLKHGISR